MLSSTNTTTTERAAMTTKRGYTASKEQLLRRLARVEGQVRGVARMVEEDRYCIDVLTQLRAVRAALSRVETEMLRDHLDHCIEAAITGGDTAEQRRKASELIELLERSAR